MTSWCAANPALDARTAVLARTARHSSPKTNHHPVRMRVLRDDLAQSAMAAPDGALLDQRRCRRGLPSRRHGVLGQVLARPDE